MNVWTANHQRQRRNMATFTIDSENNIVAHTGVPASADESQSFSTAKELAKLSAEWPASRLVDTWNGFAGVAPFDDLKPVKKFTDRKAAVARIWKAIERLSPDVAPESTPVATERTRSKKSPAKASRRARAEKDATESRTNKKAEVIAMMKRGKGVTLAEIVEATGWQKHTVRGFVSVLGSKGGEKIESAKNTAGERCYRIAK
jgi:23S rRNA pseudoU1915 N3-methylase RlmH